MPVAASYPTRMESRAAWRTCSLIALATVCIIAGLMGSSYGPDPSTQQPAEPPRARDHILLRSSRSCNPRLQTMLRTLGATSDALWGRLLDVHASPASAIVVDISVFRGSQCLEAAKKGFKTVVCFESSPVNCDATRAAAKDQNVPDKGLQLLNMAVLNVTGAEVELLLGTDSDGRYMSKMVPTTTLDDYLLPRLNLKRDDAFDAHIKDDTGHGREVGLQERKEELYMVRVEVQGFEGLVVEGMQQLLRRKQVTYLMLNIWPRMMRQAGRKSCEETLRLVADMGYTLHELALSPAVWEQGANKLKERVMAEARDHPTDIDGLCAWVLQHSSQQGLWVDVLAVHDPQLGGSSCSVDGFQAQ